MTEYSLVTDELYDEETEQVLQYRLLEDPENDDEWLYFETYLEP
jgi:hypothetical protein